MPRDQGSLISTVGSPSQSPPSSPSPAPDLDLDPPQRKKRKTNPSADTGAKNRDDSVPENGDEHRDRVVKQAKTSCEACRRRKIRCDGVRPACAYCIGRRKAKGKADWECVYPPLFIRARCDQAYVDDLEKKCKTLVAEIELLKKRLESAGVEEEIQEEDQMQPSEEDLMRNKGDFGLIMQPSMYRVHQQTRKRREAQNQGEIEMLGSSHPGRGGPSQSNSAGNDTFNVVVQEDVSGRHFANSSRSPLEGHDILDVSSAYHFAANLNAVGGVNQSVDIGRVEDRHPISATTSLMSPSDPAWMAGGRGEQERRDSRVVDLASSDPLSLAACRELLPQQYVRTALLEQFNNDFQPIWPIFLKEELKQLSQIGWVVKESDDIVSFAQLYLVLCIASQFCEDNGALPPNLPQICNDLYIRARRIIFSQCFVQSNISLLQSLLLMAHYEHATMRSSQCYLTIGIATRIALGLGLYANLSSKFALSPLKREHRRRLWWLCFSLDRTSSFTYGKPIGIPYIDDTQSQLEVSLARDDEDIIRDNPQPAGELSVNAFFRASTNLLITMDHVIQRLHKAKGIIKEKIVNGVRNDTSWPSISDGNYLLTIMAVIGELDGRMLSWHDQLPEGLKFPLEGSIEISRDSPSWLRRQANILRVRFLNMRVLLHRQTLLYLLQPVEKRNWPQSGSCLWPPLFSDCNSDMMIGASTSFVRIGTPSLFEIPMAHVSAGICLASALSVVQIIHSQSQATFTEAWWFDLNSLFNSLCVLFGAMGLRLTDLGAVVPDIAYVRTTIQQGFQAIDRIGPRAPADIAHNVRFLRRLMLSTSRRLPEDLTGNPIKQPSVLPTTQTKPTYPDSSISSHDFSNHSTINTQYQPTSDFDPNLTPATSYHDLDPTMEPSNNVHWTTDFSDLSSSWTIPDFNGAGLASGSAILPSSYLNPDSEAVGSLLEDSFSLWRFGIPEEYETWWQF